MNCGACLASTEEIALKSPSCARALKSGALPLSGEVDSHPPQDPAQGSQGGTLAEGGVGRRELVSASVDEETARARQRIREKLERLGGLRRGEHLT